ncbi:MAG: YceI family protein [Chloroflexota bacterium]
MNRYVLNVMILLVAGLMLSGCFALQEAEEASGDAQAEAVDAGGDATVFVIDAEQSEARFLIDEVLRGDDVTVVGVTNNLAGEMAINLSNPSSATIGEININARDIETDNNFRNNAIQNRILETDSYEFVTFTTTSIAGLPENAAVGNSYDVTITGDLAITDVTLEKSFDATINVISETEISGLASTVFPYADFELEIPFSQAVDSVEDDVRLELEFVATMQ